MSTLNERIGAAGGALRLLREQTSGPLPFPVRAEFTNWRDEQEAWRNSAALLDLSLHMPDLILKGPDVLRLLTDVGANGFANFGPMIAKQLLTVAPDGNMIGDAILFCISDEHVRIVGRAPALDWVQFHADTGGYDVEVSRDERIVRNPRGRELYRLQLQGPNAMEILERVTGGDVPSIPFFRMGPVRIGKHEVTALNHRMSGFPGLEFFGPYSERDAVRDTIMAAGGDLGLREVGGRAYATVATESGWIANTVPAIYEAPELDAFRDWLTDDSFAAHLSLGGSYVSDRIEDYYSTPWDLGYGGFVKFDHDFIGREALERRQNEPHRRKGWVLWDREHVGRIFTSMYEQGDQRYKYLEMPAGWYAGSQFDRLDKDGELIGAVTTTVYSSNVRGWISLGMIDESAHRVGDRIELVWGEPSGRSTIGVVEDHTQTRVGATIIDRPFSEGTEGSGKRH